MLNSKQRTCLVIKMSHVMRKFVFVICEQQRSRSACAFGLPRVPFVNWYQFMYLVISLLVLRARYVNRLYQFLIIANLLYFVVRRLDSRILLLAISKISRPWLVSEAEQARLSLTWSQTPMFSPDEAQIQLHKQQEQHKNHFLRTFGIETTRD